MGPDTWPTGEPGDPKGELNKYRDIVSGPQPDDYWTNQIGTSLDTLTLYVYKAHFKQKLRIQTFKMMFSVSHCCFIIGQELTHSLLHTLFHSFLISTHMA